MDKEKGIIYCLRNKINGKQYIGQTQDLNHRIIVHLLRKERKGVNKAIVKYGYENFDLIILEKTKIKDLNKAEIKWIKRYNTFKGSGYNLTEGGGGARGYKYSEARKKRISKQVSGVKNPRSKITMNMAKQILEDRKQGKSGYELGDKYNVSNATIYKIIQGIHWTTKSGELNIICNKLEYINLNKKVKPENIEEIRSMRRQGKTYQEIAKNYTFGYKYVSLICRGKHTLSKSPK